MLAAFMLISPAQAASDLMKEAGLTTPKPLPALQYTDEAGAAQPIDPKAARLTILHFWATWCVPCIKELPEVDAASAKYGDKGLKIITLSLDGKNLAKVKAFFAEHKITHLPPYMDVGNSVFRALSLNGLPTTIFINKKGEEVARTEGPLDWSDKTLIEFIEDSLK